MHEKLLYNLIKVQTIRIVLQKKSYERLFYLKKKYTGGKCDTWHVTGDTYHVTHNMWWEVNITSKFQLPSSYSFGVKAFWTFWGKGWLTYWLNTYKRPNTSYHKIPPSNKFSTMRRVILTKRYCTFKKSLLDIYIYLRSNQLSNSNQQMTTLFLFLSSFDIYYIFTP